MLPLHPPQKRRDNCLCLRWDNILNLEKKHWSSAKSEWRQHIWCMHAFNGSAGFALVFFWTLQMFSSPPSNVISGVLLELLVNTKLQIPHTVLFSSYWRQVYYSTFSFIFKDKAPGCCLWWKTLFILIWHVSLCSHALRCFMGFLPDLTTRSHF